MMDGEASVSVEDDGSVVAHAVLDSADVIVAVLPILRRDLELLEWFADDPDADARVHQALIAAIAAHEALLQTGYYAVANSLATTSNLSE